MKIVISCGCEFEMAAREITVRQLVGLIAEMAGLRKELSRRERDVGAAT